CLRTTTHARFCRFLFYFSIYLFVYLSICLFIYLSIYLLYPEPRRLCDRVELLAETPEARLQHARRVCPSSCFPAPALSSVSFADFSGQVRDWPAPSSSSPCYNKPRSRWQGDNSHHDAERQGTCVGLS